MNNIIKLIKRTAKFTLILSLCISGFGCMPTFAVQTVAGQEMRTQVLYLADIVVNDNNMAEPITRGEFARMVAKASPYKDGASEYIASAVFSDVPFTHPYAAFIKIATDHNYMTSFLGGLFKPEDYVTYKDLTRACLALLGYENSDFTGNQVVGRYQMFCSLDMNENIDKEINDVVTKLDCVNAIYNTLKTNKKGGSGKYGPSVFTKMTTNSDGELNASGLLKTKLEGPFVLKRGGEALNLALPFELEGANLFINGASSSVEEIYRELNNLGFLIYYYNKNTKTLYVYKEGTTPNTTMTVMRGFVQHIYYNATDTVTPTSIEVDLERYNLGNADVKFAFSYAGTLAVGDEIIFVYNKEDDQMDNETYDDLGVNTVGTITHAFLYDVKY